MMVASTSLQQPVPMPKQKPQTTEEKASTQKTRKIKIWMAFAAGVGFMAIVMGALWFFVIKANEADSNTIVAEGATSKMTFEDLMKKDASTYSFTRSDLSSLSQKELSYLRNHIYAVHGYIFKSQELNAYFSQFDWYHPNPSVTGSELNSTELANAEFLLRYEKENGAMYQLDNN